MKVLIAPDSFKGSISAFDAAEAIRDGLREVVPNMECRLFPLADGGEGTLQVISRFWKGRLIKDEVPNALGQDVWAKRGSFNDGSTAVIELAEASGIAGLEQMNPRKASTFGTGIQIKKAVEEGAKEIILTLGGSATVDAGTGLMEALGCLFFDFFGNVCSSRHNHLYGFSRVELKFARQFLEQVKWTVLADVVNPLIGTAGAFRIFGPQKGLRVEEVPLLEERVRRWALMLDPERGLSTLQVSGVGAAGGAALPLILIGQAKICNGFEWLSRQMNLEAHIKDAELIITGEGHIDDQTFMGKGPGQLAMLARKYGKKIVAIAGRANVSTPVFDEIYTLERFNKSIEELMTNSKVYLKKISRDIACGLNLF